MHNPSEQNRPQIHVTNNEDLFDISIGYPRNGTWWRCRIVHNIRGEMVLGVAMNLKDWYRQEIANQEAAHLLEEAANKA